MARVGQCLGHRFICACTRERLCEQHALQLALGAACTLAGVLRELLQKLAAAALPAAHSDLLTNANRPSTLCWLLCNEATLTAPNEALQNLISQHTKCTVSSIFGTLAPLLLVHPWKQGVLGSSSGEGMGL